MKIYYCQHRGSFKECQKTKKAFSLAKDIFPYIVEITTKIHGFSMFDENDIYVRYYTYDERVHKEAFLVCIGKYGEEKYKYPQAHGWVYLDSKWQDKVDKWKQTYKDKHVSAQEFIKFFDSNTIKILLSTNPPYSQLIGDEYKFMEFRNTAPRVIPKNIVLSPEDTKIYIYETKNHGGCGKVIGEASLLTIHHLKYKSLDGYAVGPELTKTRGSFLGELYDSYCFVKHLTPKLNLANLTKTEERQFKKYQFEIGFNFDVDYAWELTNIIKYEEPKDLKELGITRAPQSWCFIDRKRNANFLEGEK